MILLSKTYTETTPESSEDGENSDSGFIFENVPHTFRETVAMLREHRNPSHWPLKGAYAPGVWFSSGYETEDYTTGTERETAIHFCRENEPRAIKYWILAARVAQVGGL